MNIQRESIPINNVTILTLFINSLSEKALIVKWQKDIEQESNKLFERKSELEKMYNESVDFYCKYDDAYIKITDKLKNALWTIKRFQILQSRKQVLSDFGYQSFYRIFDLHKDYSGFTIGEKEFKIQKVNLLDNNNHEFVFIDRQNSAFNKAINNDESSAMEGFKGIAEDNDLYITTTGSGVIQESINLIQNYVVDFEDNKNMIGIGSQFQNYLQPMDMKHGGVVQTRSRTNTFDEFDQFEGEKCTESKMKIEEPVQKEQIIEKQKFKEAKKQIKEAYASFIALNSSDYDQFSSYSDLFQRQKTMDRLEKIHGNIHSLCMIIIGISRFLQVPLPYPLRIISQGYEIRDSSKKSHPLYLRTDPTKLIDMKHQIQFENGIILLDKDIQFLLYINGYKLTMGSNNGQILNLSPIFSLRALGQSFIIETKLMPQRKKRLEVTEGLVVPIEIFEDEYDLDQFEVLKLQNRQLSANLQLESMRTSEMGAAGFVTNIEDEPNKHKNRHGEWSDDETYKELLDNARKLDLSTLIQNDYLSQSQ